MTIEELAGALELSLIVLGVVFLAVNLRVGRDIWRFWRRRAGALLVWPAPAPPYYALNLAIGVMLGVLLFVTVFLVPRPAGSIFGEAMMFVYYGYLLPLSTRILRGLYADGVWTDSGFMAYGDIGGLTWKAGTTDTLVLASRLRAFARTLTIPGTRLGEVRRMLREKIGEHAIEFDDGPGLHLGSRDTRESV
ncbi:MAG: hypothetical protein IT180_10925 [Acidobacteria bacterium]|nr:hypothetical protein [Acidobacteriota bacterium]